jgi:endonuclease YncB( thermonuclease family)
LPERARGNATAVTGDSLRLDTAPDDEVHLAGVLAPQGRLNTFAAPFATAAHNGLAEVLNGHTVSVLAAEGAVDRRGHIHAQLRRDDGLWIQADLVRRGLVRVAATADSADFVSTLLLLERAARDQRKGLWSLDVYAVRDADDLTQLNRDVGTYQLVAGTVANTARRGDQIYLNFGDDYRTDMTVEIPRDAWPRFTKLKPQMLTGRHIQVRGWLMRHNGPALVLTAPALLEVLD